MTVLPNNSVMDALRARRELLSESRSATFDVPGYNGMLVVVAQPLTFVALKQIAEAHEASKAPDAELLVMVDTIIKATSEVGYRDEAGAFHSFDAESPFRWDSRLAEFMGISDVESSREVFFRILPHDMAIIGLHNQIASWMQTAKRDDDKTFVGESEGTTRSA